MPDRATIARMQMFEGGIGFTGDITEAMLPVVPAKRGVMLLLAADLEPIVLMTAANLRSRLRARLKDPNDETHGRLPDLGRITRQILWTLTTDTFETDLVYLSHAAVLHETALARYVAWKPPWLVHVDLADRFPDFQRVRGAMGSTGECFGPLATGKSANAFIALLQDILDLCRKPECGRLAALAPSEVEGDGPRCPYAQMNKCLVVCDGTISLEDYTRHVARAAEVAKGPGGARQALREYLEAAMKDAAAELQFEQAASLKAKCDKLDRLDAREFANVRTLKEFRFLVLQRGTGRRNIKAFLAAGGSIVPAPALNWPLDDAQLSDLHARMTAHRPSAGPATAAGDYRMGLVARMLTGRDDQKQRLVRWHDGITVAQFREAVEAAADVLGVSKPRAKPPADP